MPRNLLETASVQYGDWNGTAAADDVDLKHAEEFFGIDGELHRVLAIDITIYGGHQRLEAYGVPASHGYKDLEGLTDAGEPIRAQLLASIEYDHAGHGDTNPPPPLSLPVQSATEYLAYGFKRLHLRLVTRNLPPGAQLVAGDAD